MSGHEKGSVGRDGKLAAWQQPQLRFVGNVGSVLQGGTGKLSPTDNDSGDNRKPKGKG